MQLSKTIISLLALGLASAVMSVAQEPAYRLPGQHSQQNADLLANQEMMTDQITLDVNNYIDFAEEEEPELDIYTEGWNSKSINCYQGMDVPQTALINVSKFSMPHPGYITSPYGYRRRFRRQHKGVDIKLNIGIVGALGAAGGRYQRHGKQRSRGGCHHSKFLHYNEVLIQRYYNLQI